MQPLHDTTICMSSTLSKALKSRIDRLREASRVFVRQQGVLRAEQKGTSLSYAEGHALIELEKKTALTVVELAEILGLNKSSTSRTLGRLKHKGWILEESDPIDSRRKPVVLTRQGRRRLQSLHDQVYKRTAKALGLLSPGEQEIVVKGFEMYSQALSKLNSNAD